MQNNYILEDCRKYKQMQGMREANAKSGGMTMQPSHCAVKYVRSQIDYEVISALYKPDS